MRYDKELNYILNFETSGVLDLAFGIECVTENKNKLIRCGLGTHSISFVISEIVFEDSSMIRFKISNGEIISLKIITAEDYKDLKGILFSNNAPPISNDLEVQEFITQQREY